MHYSYFNSIDLDQTLLKTKRFSERKYSNVLSLKCYSIKKVTKKDFLNKMKILRKENRNANNTAVSINNSIGLMMSFHCFQNYLGLFFCTKSTS